MRRQPIKVFFCRQGSSYLIFGDTSNLQKYQEVIITAMGPIVTFVLATIFYLVWKEKQEMIILLLLAFWNSVFRLNVLIDGAGSDEYKLSNILDTSPYLFQIISIILCAVLIFLIIIVILLIPLIFKDKGHTGFDAPDLSELNYFEVYFTNDSENIKLAGMLMLPEGTGAWPVAVIIQGSGPSFRNNGWYLSVAKHLQENGIAVLIPDKRGCEKSEGEWIGANIEELATDASSAIEFIKDHENLMHSHIGLIGMSHGLHHFKTKTYPKGGHGIIDVTSNTMNKEYLNDLVTFIKGIKN